MSFALPPAEIAATAILNEANCLGRAVAFRMFLSPRNDEELEEAGHLFARACGREARISPPFAIATIASEVAVTAMDGYRRGLDYMRSSDGAALISAGLSEKDSMAVMRRGAERSFALRSVPAFEAANPTLQPLILSFSEESAKGAVSALRILQWARALYEAEMGGMG